MPRPYGFGGTRLLRGDGRGMPRPYGVGDVRGYPVGGGHARPVFFPPAPCFSRPRWGYPRSRRCIIVSALSISSSPLKMAMLAIAIP